MNKIQRLAKKVNIENQNQLRVALKPYGIAEATTRDVWLHGVTTRNHFAVVYALEMVLLTPAIQFLEDAQSLIPEKGV